VRVALYFCPMEHTKKTVGVIGAGSFGSALAGLLAENQPVLLYSRKTEVAESINKTRIHNGFPIHPNITAISSPMEMAERCNLLFPVIASDGFRSVMKLYADHLKPWHILIHGTKGLDLGNLSQVDLQAARHLHRRQINTMSEVILQETSVVRVGCLSGPNLAREIQLGQPAATLIASRYSEVIETGIAALHSHRFSVFGSPEILGAELSGAFKNIIALASGILAGLGMGRNLQSMLITKGLSEIIHLADALGAGKTAFFGTAGIGDIVATATSTDSRNYSFGLRIGQGEKVPDIVNSLKEVAEGVRTLLIARRLIRQYKLHSPIVYIIHKVVFEEYPADKALSYLIDYPYTIDVDFV
jgi:glycerol-3-phosphate dehydrogenase (NAD(P)+)